jgi:hypothetical protein
LSNLRNHLSRIAAYSYHQNHCSDKQSNAARRIRPAAVATPTGDVLAPELHTVQKTA